jgi:hypothetical protein
VAGGIVVAGDHIVEITRSDRAAYVTWDGSVVDLGALRSDFKVSQDGLSLAAHELGTGRRASSILHLIDLTDGTRHILTLQRNVDLRITGVSHDTIWYRPRGAHPQEMSWTTGSAGAVLALEPPPAGSWEDPAAPQHRHYTTHHYGLSFDARHSITIHDSGEHRTYGMPEPAQVDHRVRPVWEDPDHLLLVTAPTINGGLEFSGCIFRLNVNTGALETAATDTPVRTFIWPWPRRPDGRFSPLGPRRHL